jgi:hypothetical protein
MNTNRTIASSYCARRGRSKKKKLGQKTIIPKSVPGISLQNEKEKEKEKEQEKETIDLKKLVQVDLRPDWMKDLRVVKGLTLRDQYMIQSVWTRYSGYKITSRSMQGVHGFKYELGRQYSQSKPVELCISGFHFSPDPLQCLRYALAHKFEEPWRLFKVQGAGSAATADDKICVQQIKLDSEITDEKEKNDLLTGVSITDDAVHCFKNGQLFNGLEPHCSNSYNRFPSNTVEILSGERRRIIKSKWPPSPFDEILCPAAPAQPVAPPAQEANQIS